MSTFFKNLFTRTEIADEASHQLEASLSFLSSRMDEQLSQAAVEQSADVALWEPYEEFLKRSLPQRMDQPIAIAVELDMLQRYVSCFKAIHAMAAPIKWDIKVEESCHVPAFILFPLIENALKVGYTSLAEAPLKIQIRSYAKSLSLTVSNRVNHHVESQQHTQILHWYESRLRHIFGDRYTLLYNSNSYTFKATLNLFF